jgi:hypothetical protein
MREWWVWNLAFGMYDKEVLLRVLSFAERTMDFLTSEEDDD